MTHRHAAAHAACEPLCASAGARVFVNASAASAAPPALSPAFVERTQACPLAPLSHTRSAPPCSPKHPQHVPRQGLEPLVLPASSSPVAPNGTAFPPLRPANNRRAWRRSPTAAASSPGAPGASRVHSACAQRVSRGRRHPPGMPAGHRSMLNRHASQARHTKRPCAPWPAPGAASSLGVGRSAPPLRHPSLSKRSNAATRHACTTWCMYLAKDEKNPDSPPQSMCSARS